MPRAQNALMEPESVSENPEHAEDASEKKDKRRYERRKLKADVRFATHANVEASGRLHDISEGGLYILSDMDLRIGDAIIAYPEGLGRVEGAVVRKDSAGFAIEFSITDSQREYLAKRIDSAQSGAPYLRLADRRKHERTSINLDATAELLATGETFQCMLSDISCSGAAVRSDHCPPLGADIKIGMLRGDVSRHAPDGFAISFKGTGKS